MTGRLVSLAAVAGVVLALAGIATPASVPASPSASAFADGIADAMAARSVTPVVPASHVTPVDLGSAEVAITIDWRVLAGLDYAKGRVTDTLRKLDGKLVRVPGFVVPLDDFQEDGAEFLLVPYYGACVHSPPPPPNQIVMVAMAGRKSVRLNLFEAIWMSGRLKIANIESPYGTVGYQLEGVKIEPYSSK